MNTLWSEYYINSSEPRLQQYHVDMPYWAQLTFAHEMGHALGLWHHNDSFYLMRPTAGSVPNYSYPNGPAAGDLGPNPPCSGAISTWGIRCIYLWSAN